MNATLQTALLHPFSLLSPLYPHHPARIVTTTEESNRFLLVLDLYAFSDHFSCRCESTTQRRFLQRWLTCLMLENLGNDGTWPYAMSAKAFLVWCTSNPTQTHHNI